MSHTLDKLPNKGDYESDFAVWIERQVALLREAKFDELDRENLLEEFESMGSNLHHELRSRLIVLLAHLLKCKYQPQRKCKSWFSTLSEQRAQIALRLEQSPSLRSPVDHDIAAAYRSAVYRASVETGIPESTFPRTPPFSQAEILNLRFMP